MNTNQLTCKNCGSDNIDEFCSHCGQKTYTKRFTTKSFLIKFLSAFDIEKGFFYTIKMLFVNPGELINNYLAGKTKSYYNPLNYILLLTGIATALMVWLGIFDASVQSTNETLGLVRPEQKDFQQGMMNQMKQYINIITLFMLPFMSLFSKWYFHKKKLYYGEHLIMNSFLFGQSSVISIITLPIFVILPLLAGYYSPIGVIIFLVYYSYALKSTFKSTTFKSVLGSVVIFIGGYLLFTIFLMIIGLGVIIIMVASGMNIKDIIQ